MKKAPLLRRAALKTWVRIHLQEFGLTASFPGVDWTRYKTNNQIPHTDGGPHKISEGTKKERDTKLMLILATTFCLHGPTAVHAPL